MSAFNESLGERTGSKRKRGDPNPVAMSKGTPIIEILDSSDSSDDEAPNAVGQITTAEEDIIVVTIDSETESDHSEDDDNAATCEKDNQGHLSNIASVTPLVGMKLEVRDSDYIWSAARLVEVVKKGNTIIVTVHCEGWDSAQWDEQLSWPNHRLARLHTFTKRVKCFVDMIPKVKSRTGKGHGTKNTKISSSVWPCTVQIRMPHPVEDGCNDEEYCLMAEELLKLEEKLFVQPYGTSLLPKWIEASLERDEGRWFHNKKLRLWKDDTSALGLLPKDFEKAMELGRNDTVISSYLHPKTFKKGSLVEDFYRVHTRAGEDVGGALRVGVVSRPPIRKEEPPPITLNLPELSPPTKEKMKEDSKGNEVLKYEPPPFFPPLIRLEQPTYPGVTQCKKENRWIASASIGGNDIFLGSFPTQTQAWTATQMLTNNGTEMNNDFDAARIADMRAVPIETIIDVVESRWNPSVQTFSLHEWTLQKIRHTAYKKKLKQSKATVKASKVKSKEDHTDHPPPIKTGRMKSRPRKVDVVKGIYVKY